MSTKSGSASNEQTDAPGSENKEFSFLYDLTSTPCFRQSTLYAIGGGGAIGGLKLLQTSGEENVMQAADTMVKTGCGIALLNWVICRKRYYDEREATYSAVEKLKKQQSVKAAARAKEMREGSVEKDS